jgi:DNA ligase (NAD+)
VEHPGGEVAAYCSNPNDPVRLMRWVEHFAGRGAMDIEGFGEKQAVLFVRLGLVKDVADVYYLKPEPLLELEGFGEKKVANLMAAIEASQTRPLWRLIYGLGPRHVGGTNAELLARHYASLDALARATADDLQGIAGIGPEVACSIVEFFADPRVKTIIKKLKAAGVKTEADAPAKPVEGPLAGKTFVITGTLPTLSRDEARAYVLARGGRVTDSVSKNTDYLVAGEAPGASKTDRAQKLGIPVIGEAELRRLGGK